MSLTDHYWLQPVGQELYWKDLNFYENDFSDELVSSAVNYYYSRRVKWQRE